MTPCEKLGYKVGDRFEVCEKAGYGFELGDIAVLDDDDGSRIPFFTNEKTGVRAPLFIQKEDGTFPEGGVCVKPAALPALQNPIEYLKSAHANGDTINPETMLSECFGITKTERVITEWSEVKREIKVGDKVRIVGDSNVDYKEDRMYIIGDTATVSEIGVPGYRLHLNGCLYIWFPASSVELV